MLAGREKSLIQIIKKTALFFMGLAGGVGVAAGIYAFIVMLQIIQRFSNRTGTAKYITFYEDCVMFGGILGNMVSVFEFPIPLGPVFLCFYGTCTGIFVGCLAIALAEVIDVIPAVSRRIGIRSGVPFLVLCIGLGKGIGAVYQLVIAR